MENEYVVYSPSCCSEHGDAEWYNCKTLEEAKKIATRGDTIFKVIEEVER